MTSVDVDPLSGAAFDQIKQDHSILKDFLDFARQRVELDRKYAKDLQALRDSVPPSWADSALWPLISPFINKIDEEVRLRGAMTRALVTNTEGLPRNKILDKPDRKGVTANVKYERLRPAYDEYQKCLSAVNTKESIVSLQAWYKQKRSELKPVWMMTSEEIAQYVFPEIDRKFRASVVIQQDYARVAKRWHVDALPVYFERHQRDMEDLKSMLLSMSTNYSRFALRLTQYWASMMHSTANFSSSHYIAPFHASQEQEESHILFQPVVYRNYYTDGLPAHPKFGLKPSLQEILSTFCYEKILIIDPISIEDTFELEKDPNFIYPPYRSKAVTSRDARRIELLSCFSHPPLLSLPDGKRNLYSEKCPRSKLETLMSNLPDETKATMKCWIPGGHYSRGIALLWCHNTQLSQLILNIARKWDFENDRPLPADAIRYYHIKHDYLLGFEFAGPPRLISKTTAAPYYK